MNKLLTKKEMASFLGISLNTLNVWISRRKIPYLKLGKAKNALVRFSLDQVEEWMRDMKGKKKDLA